LLAQLSSQTLEYKHFIAWLIMLRESYLKLVFIILFFILKLTFANKNLWNFLRFIKDYDGGLLMECKIDPKLPYTDLSSMIRQQRKVSLWKYLLCGEKISRAFRFIYTQIVLQVTKLFVYFLYFHYLTLALWLILKKI